MLGAIIGDIVGSPYEAHPIRTTAFPLFSPASRFTDDTVCTVAVADCLMNRGDFAVYLRAYVRRYPQAGYGGMFLGWGLSEGMPPYNSWGNGSAMRVAPIGWVTDDPDEVLVLAGRSAAVSHDHPEAIAGAQATALAVLRARQGVHRDLIRREIGARFGYDLSESVAAIRARYAFTVRCAETVPPAIVSALEAADFEGAIRNAVSLGGDSDTLACIAGGIAEPLYGLPELTAEAALARLDDHLRDVVEQFRAAYPAAGRAM